jgi:hypothetical protein
MNMSKELLDKLKKIKEQKVNEGDVFAIDLAHIGSHSYKPDPKAFSDTKGPYAYGRIIHNDPSSGVIVEIFDHTGPLTDDLGFILKHKRMFDPVNVAGLLFKSARWRTIDADPSFTKEKAGFKNIKLVMGIAPDLTLWTGGKKSPISAKEAAQYESYDVLFCEDVEQSILDKIEG